MIFWWNSFDDSRSEVSFHRFVRLSEIWIFQLNFIGIFHWKKKWFEKNIRAAIHQTQDNDQLGWHTRPMNKSIWQRRQLVQRGLHTAHKCRYQRPDGATHKTLSLLIRSGGCVIERCSWVTHGRCQPNANVFQRKFKREKTRKKLTAVKVNQANRTAAIFAAVLLLFFPSVVGVTACYAD